MKCHPEVKIYLSTCCKEILTKELFCVKILCFCFLVSHGEFNIH